jgi:Flp pilus assembly protein TadG
MIEKKKILLFLLIIPIIFLCNFISAYSGLGDGTYEDPYQITSWSQLNETRDYNGSSFKLMNDLNSSTTGYETYAGNSANGGAGWIPINFNSSINNVCYDPVQPFVINLEGNKHKISDLYIYQGTGFYIGLFSVLRNSTISNLILSNISINGRDVVGSIAGYSYSSNIVNFSSNGIVTSLYNYVGSSCSDNEGGKETGGIFGYSYKTNISNCYSTATLKGCEYVGGLVGYASVSIINNSYFGGIVNGSWDCGIMNEEVGGLVGLIQSTNISNSFVYGLVTDDNVGNNYIQGIVGYSYSGNVNDSFYDNQTTGQDSDTWGGGAGKLTAQLKNISTFNDTSTEGLNNPWDICSIAIGGKNESCIWNIANGLAYPFLSWSNISQPFISLSSPAEGDSFTFNNVNFSLIIIDETNLGVKNVSLYLNGILNQTNSSGIAGSYQFSVSGFSTGGYNWTIKAYDNLSNFYTTETRNFYVFYFTGSGNGSLNDPYQITSWDELNQIRYNQITSYYKLMNDLNSSTTGYETYASNSSNSGLGWLPIGDLTNYPDNTFHGFFDGNNKVIKDIFINRPSENYVGLFGYTYNNLNISNLGIENGNITGNIEVGGLAGSSSYNISNCYFDGYIYGNEEVGGLVGRLNTYGRITFSHSNSTIQCNKTSGESCGGLVGFDYGFISNSYSLGNVNGYSYVGGLIGRFQFASLIDSYSIANVYSNVKDYDFVNPYTGGLIGGGQFMNVNNSYSTGFVNSTTTMSAGTVGGLIGDSDIPNSVINNSFWDTQTSGKSTSRGGTGKTTVQMNNVSTFTDIVTVNLSEAWDFAFNPNNDNKNNNYWHINSNINNGYPYLLTEKDVLVNLNTPSNGSASSSTQNFNFSVSSGARTELTNMTYFLWNNGDLINKTVFNISGYENSSLISITFDANGWYKWNVLACNNLNYCSYSETNYTVYVDLLKPAINLIFPIDSATLSSSSIAFFYLAQHSTKTIDTCQLYSDYEGNWSTIDSDYPISELNINYFIEDVPDGNYTWNIWCNTTDGYSGFALKNYSFTVDTSGTTPGGSGGGTIIIGSLLAENFSVVSSGYGNTMDLVLAKGSVRERQKEFILVNKGIDSFKVKLSCNTNDVDINVSEGAKTDINICDYVRFEQDELDISSNEDSPTIGKVYVMTPINAEFGDKYAFNIIATREESGMTSYSKLSISARVTYWALLFKYSYVPFQAEDKVDKSMYPVSLIAGLLSIALFSFILFLLRKFILAGFFVGLLLSLISFILMLVFF